VVRESFEYTVMQPTGPSGVWSFQSGAEDFLENGKWDYAQDDDGNYLDDPVTGEPVMRQVTPAPPPTSYLATRRRIETDWERVVPALDPGAL
jgi:hypothetical protein